MQLSIKGFRFIGKHPDGVIVTPFIRFGNNAVSESCVLDTTVATHANIK